MYSFQKNFSALCGQITHSRQNSSTFMQNWDDAIRRSVWENLSQAFTNENTTCIKKYTHSNPLELFYNLGKPSPYAQQIG